MGKRSWRAAEAKVVEWKPTFEGYDELSGTPLPNEFLVTVHYVVNGKTYSTTFKATQQYEEGGTLMLRYDSNDPSVTDLKLTGRMKLMSWIVGLLLAAGLIWLGEQMLR